MTTLPSKDAANVPRYGDFPQNERVERMTLTFPQGSYVYPWQIDAPDGLKISGSFRGILVVEADVRVADVKLYPQAQFRRVLGIEKVIRMSFDVDVKDA